MKLVVCTNVTAVSCVPQSKHNSFFLNPGSVLLDQCVSLLQPSIVVMVSYSNFVRVGGGGRMEGRSGCCV